MCWWCGGNEKLRCVLRLCPTVASLAQCDNTDIYDDHQFDCPVSHTTIKIIIIQRMGHFLVLFQIVIELI